jgi:hypothetical protein
MFQKATKYQSKLRMALLGPAGSGKTYTALSIAQHMAADGRIALLDTERGTARKYGDLFDFDVQELTSFAPASYIECIREAEQSGEHTVLIIDSLSHAWMGRDGILEMKDRVDARSKGTAGSNSFTNWREVTPEHNRLVDAMLDCKLHLIVTMRTKMDYLMTTGENGKPKVEKVGMAPIQRDGLEYEFDIIGDLNLDNDLVIGKTRCPALKGMVFAEAGIEVALVLNEWLETGVEPPKRAWTKQEALDWVNRKLFEGYSQEQLKSALTISNGWGDWTGDTDDADAALIQWEAS